MMQFCSVFSRKIAPGVPLHQIQDTALEVLLSLPPPDYSGGSANDSLQLVFRHDCQYVSPPGCYVFIYFYALKPIFFFLKKFSPLLSNNN